MPYSIEKAREDVEKAKKEAESEIKYHSEQIEILIGRMERADIEKVFGYGSEIKDHAEKIDEVAESIKDLIKSLDDMEKTDEEDLEDELRFFEKDVNEFFRKYKKAEDTTIQDIVARAVRKLKKS